MKCMASILKLILIQAERARTEEQLQHTNAQLRQRTADLQQEQVCMSEYIKLINKLIVIVLG